MDEQVQVTRPEWAEVGKRWEKIPKEERLALPPRLTILIRAEMQAYQEARERKNIAYKARKKSQAEDEAWAEYAAKEKADKLARAIRKLRARQ